MDDKRSLTGLDLTDFDDPLVVGLYQQRKDLTPEEILEVTASGKHPLAHWSESYASDDAFRDMKEQTKEAFQKARELLSKEALSVTERASLTSFLKMLSINDGKVSVRENFSVWLYHHLPWFAFFKNALYGHPYSSFFFVWGMLILNLSVLVFYNSLDLSGPIIFSSLIPLALTFLLVLVVWVKDTDKYLLNNQTRFFAILPIVTILLLSVGLMSTFGYLPMALSERSAVVVSRDGAIKNFVHKDLRLVKYPNIWSAVVDGDSLISPPMSKSEIKELKYNVPSLKNGEFRILYSLFLTGNSDSLIGQNLEALGVEAQELDQRAAQVTGLWAQNYTTSGQNNSIVEILNQLQTAHYSVKAMPGVLAWTEVETKRVKKLVEDTVTKEVEVDAEEVYLKAIPIE